MIQTDDNNITVDVVVEAIIRNNKDNLLKRFISEYDYVKIVNGALVTEVRLDSVITMKKIQFYLDLFSINMFL